MVIKTKNTSSRLIFHDDRGSQYTSNYFKK